MAKRKSAADESEPAASFEESLGELQSIVSELEDGEIGLEASLARFERGIRLLRTCYAILETAEAKVELLTRFQDGEPTVTSFEATATIETVRGSVETEDDASENTLF